MKRKIIVIFLLVFTLSSCNNLFPEYNSDLWEIENASDSYILNHFPQYYTRYEGHYKKGVLGSWHYNDEVPTDDYESRYISIYFKETSKVDLYIMYSTGKYTGYEESGTYRYTLSRNGKNHYVQIANTKYQYWVSPHYLVLQML